MLRYIAKRVLLMIPVLLGISFLIFLLMYFTPGDPAQMILGDLAEKEEVEALREKMGLNDSFFERYFKYIAGLFQGDLGISYTSKLPVWDEIAARLPVTAKVAFFVILFSVIIGVPIGILSAVRQYSLIDSISYATIAKRASCHQSTLSKFIHDSSDLSDEMAAVMANGINSLLEDIRSLYIFN